MRGRQRGQRSVWRPDGRRAGRMLAVCGVAGGSLLAAATGQPGWARVSGAPPPSAGAVSAAAGQVSSHTAALNAARVQLATANARLSGLQVQAEQVIERYDKSIVDEHQAAVAYQAAQARLARAAKAESASRRQVAAFAAQDYEAGAGAGSMVAMLGNPGGPQAFFSGANDQQQLAQQGLDVLSQDQATRVVADVFRAQASHELSDEQAAARHAAALKTAILAAIGRQQAAVRVSQASTKRLETELGAAQAREYELEQARRQVLAAGQAKRAGTGGPAASSPSPEGGSSYAGWPSAYSLSQGASQAQGNIAADWALSQIGKPYQWGGAGPDTYDCSGLTMDAWAHAGVQLLHWTGYQWPSGPHIPLDQLRRGDLLFFATNTADPATIHHVGIYIGGDEMVDAPYTGVDVRIDSIYQPGGLIGATRPAG